jgi:spore germination cell wall hydrolase CwlJ-like protein
MKILKTIILAALLSTSFVAHAANFDQQHDCLSRMIYHEARGEGYLGGLAVAMVVINRTKSGIYPPDICDVVAEKTEFPDYLHWPIYEKSAWNDSQGIALNAMLRYNEIVDPTHGSLFFHSTRIKVFWKSSRVVTIGHHAFYRIKGTPIYNMKDKE